MTVVNRFTGRVFEQVGTLSPELQHTMQSVIVILTTPIGTRFWNREFGSGLFALIDEPINERTKLAIFAEAVEAIERFEDRVVITSVSMDETDALAGKVSLDINMIYVPENRFITLEGVVLR